MRVKCHRYRLRIRSKSKKILLLDWDITYYIRCWHKSRACFVSCNRIVSGGCYTFPCSISKGHFSCPVLQLHCNKRSKPNVCWYLARIAGHWHWFWFVLKNGISANSINRPIADSIMAQRRRRWANIAAMGECIVFAVFSGRSQIWYWFIYKLSFGSPRACDDHNKYIDWIELLQNLVEQ